MRALALAAIATLAGCTAPAFLGNTGRTTPKGDFRVGLGTSYQVNTQAADVVSDGRDAARTLADRTQDCGAEGSCWRVADVEPVVDAVFRLATVAPLSTSTAVSARYGIGKGFDAGVRWGSGSWGLDLGFQAFGPRDDGAAGLAGTFLAGWGKRDMGVLGDTIESVLHGEASLTDWSGAFVLGRQWGTWAQTFAAARYTYTTWDLTVIPDLPILYDAGEVQRELLGTDPDGTIHTSGGALGAALGWKRVWVGAEVNFLVTAGTATVLFEQRDLDSFGVMPAFYLYGQF